MKSLYLFGLGLVLAGVVACSDSGPSTAAPVATSTAPAGQSSGASSTTAPPDGSAAGGLGPAHFEVDRAMAHIEELSATIGPRIAGTANEEQAAEYIRDQFA